MLGAIETMPRAGIHAGINNPTHTSIMSKIVPLISSAVAGPLGIIHLPRLWLKASLEATGKLHPDYPGCGKGYDQMVLDAIGIDREQFLSFIKSARPSYAQLEAWVEAYPGARLDKASIYKNNAAICGYIHGDDTRKGILSAAGLADDGSVNPGAVDLNNLDDWTSFWSEELK